MYTLNQIFRLTPKNIREHAKSVSSNVIRSYYHIDNEIVYRKMNIWSRDPQGSGKAHYVTIKLYGLHQDILKDHVWASCDCEFFLYTVEVALAAQYSSSVIYSNGAYPIIRNPQLKGYACKHIFACLPLLKNIKFKETKKLQNYILKTPMPIIHKTVQKSKRM